MLGPHATVCIDIPIGLSSDGFRACDRAARQLLGKRSSSVFPVPPRLALAALNYEEINFASKAHCGKGVSKQAFYLLPKIREAEALLRSSDSDNFDWLETHPELCFSSFNGAVPMEHTKKTDAGFRERRRILSRHIETKTVDRLIRNLMASVPRGQCARDDMSMHLCVVLWRALTKNGLPPGVQELRICYLMASVTSRNPPVLLPAQIDMVDACQLCVDLSGLYFAFMDIDFVRGHQFKRSIPPTQLDLCS